MRKEHVGQLKPGEKFERHTIVRLIEAGGMGEVYEAIHDFTGRRVALKVLRLERASEEFRRRMIAEARLLCSFEHPNVVQVYDAGCTENGNVWFTMELLKGESLRALLRRRGRLPLAEVIHIGRGIARGAAAAHEMGIVHRDLKPENVFVTDKNEVKVLDLGAAKFKGGAVVESTGRQQIIGTPHYMSPEHLRGFRIDERTDIYAIGHILYEMSAGKYAFDSPHESGERPSSADIAHIQLFAEPRPILNLPEDLWGVIRKSLSKERGDRYASAVELDAALRAVGKRLKEQGEVATAEGGELSPSKPPKLVGPQRAPSSGTEVMKPVETDFAKGNAEQGAERPIPCLGTEVMSPLEHDLASTRPALPMDMASVRDPAIAAFHEDSTTDVLSRSRERTEPVAHGPSISPNTLSTLRSSSLSSDLRRATDSGSPKTASFALRDVTESRTLRAAAGVFVLGVCASLIIGVQRLAVPERPNTSEVAAAVPVLPAKLPVSPLSSTSPSANVLARASPDPSASATPSVFQSSKGAKTSEPKSKPRATSSATRPAPTTVPPAPRRMF